MKIETCISCQGEKDFSLAKKTNIQTDALIISQCGEKGMLEEEIDGHRVRLLLSDETGLCNSRNIAIEKAEGDVILFCDDDEHLYRFHDQTIKDAYERLPDADLICFRFANQPSRLQQYEQALNKWTCLRISSWQISAKRASLLDHGIRFDPRMGAGSGNGAGEEGKFLRDCLGMGLKVYYVPADIGTVDNRYYESGQAQGTWFTGYDRRFFYQRGTSTRYVMGLVPSVAYAAYYAVVKRKQFAGQMHPAKAFLYTLQGIAGNDIGRKEA